MPHAHFIVFMAVTLLLFAAILRWTLRARKAQPSISSLGAVSFVVVIVGMAFAKFGANSGLTWPIYYGVPAITALALPPIVFRMRAGEMAWYLCLAFASSPAIHVFFSFFIGWHEYLPFWHIPSLRD